MAKHSGSIAIPFLVTMLVSLILVGGAAFYFYLDYTKVDTDLQPMPRATAMITEEDRMTFLCVLDAGEGEVPTSYLLFRFNPVTKKNICFSMPNNLQLTSDGKTSDVNSVYTTGGISALRKAVDDTLSISIDRYVIFDSTSFQDFCDIVGGVECTVPERMKGLDKSSTSTFLAGKQIQLLISHEYAGGELQRSTVMGNAIAEMLNQADHERILQTLDLTFLSVLNSVTSDFSALDYQEHKHAFSYMVQYVPYSCIYLFPSTTTSGEQIVLTDTFTETLREKLS